MSRKKTLRWIVSGSLLAAVALVGISVYQVELNQRNRVGLQESAENEDHEDAEEIRSGGNSTAADEDSPHYAVVDDEEEELPTAETSSDQVIAQMDKEEVKEEISAAKETAGASIIVPEISFTEDTLLDWPVNGTIIMDYSMDHTVYFPTLDVYKYNPSVILGAEVGEPVEAAANCKIISIEESIETGVTITADMGNGYQTIYGQLKDVLVKKNDTVAAGTVLGYIEEPTHFYTEEGSNLYFAMKKDGVYVDPVLYLP